MSSERLPLNSGPCARSPRLTAVVAHGGQIVRIGSGAPIVVQSMTNTDTADAAGTTAQVAALARAGSELVRVTVNTPAAAAAVPRIREQLDAQGIEVPLIGDFHYNGHKLLADHPDCALALSKYRINPGNVGQGDRHDAQFARIVEAACRHGKPVRIGGQLGQPGPGPSWPGSWTRTPAGRCPGAPRR